MTHTLPDLPYPRNALEPHISSETLDYHYGKHHQTYVTNLNNLIANTEYAESTLEEIISSAPQGGLFNNAAQVYNHTFYWQSLSPDGGGDPSGELADEIVSAFGSLQTFRDRFTASAIANFGSGWTWLTQNAAGKLEIVNTSNAGNPMTAGHRPLLTCDVWEHAYYIDYRNSRPNYLKAYWELINWNFATANLS